MLRFFKNSFIKLKSKLKRAQRLRKVFFFNYKNVIIVNKNDILAPTPI